MTGKDEIEYCKEDIVKRFGFTKIKSVVAGGKERYHSVACGLRALKETEEEYGVVLIHDGARPFVSPEMIGRLIAETRQKQACVIGTPVKDTIKIAGEDGCCEQTPPRDRVWAVQTPQSFEFKLVYDAYKQLLENEDELIARGVRITDDAMVVEQMTDKKVYLVEGEYTNIKLTTPEDLVISEAFLKKIKK